MADRDQQVVFPSFVVLDAGAGTVVYPPGGSHGPRIQSFMQLVLLHSGSLRLEIDGVSYQVPVGHVALLKPGHHEYFAFAEECETWHRWICATIMPLDERAAAYCDSLPLHIPISERMNALVDLMLGLQKTGDRNTNSSVLQALVYSGILLYLTECRRLGEADRCHQAVQRAKEIIHDRYASDLSIRELAAASGVAFEHLIRLFRRHEGITPYDYLWRYRLSQSVELLRITGLSIGEIAERSGFKSHYHFTRMFKRHYGKTPSEIRRECWSIFDSRENRGHHLTGEIQNERTNP